MENKLYVNLKHILQPIDPIKNVILWTLAAAYLEWPDWLLYTLYALEAVKVVGWILQYRAATFIEFKDGSE